jgi:hypothetical protein
VTAYDWATDPRSLLHLTAVVTVLFGLRVYVREIVRYVKTPAPGSHTTTRNDYPPM